MKEMNTKQIEQQGVQALRTYVEKKFGATAKIEDIRNKGNLGKKYGCDLILSVHNRRYYIELKSSLGKDLPTNIRFTHQTVAKMHEAGELPEMIVAFVYNLADGPTTAKFMFFRFGDFTPEEILVEPHFIIQPKQIIKKGSEDQRIRESLEEVLMSSPGGHDIEKVFGTPVKEHMKLKK
jgi:hypothetical protein